MVDRISQNSRHIPPRITLPDRQFEDMCVSETGLVGADQSSRSDFVKVSSRTKVNINYLNGRVPRSMYDGDHSTTYEKESSGRRSLPPLPSRLVPSIDFEDVAWTVTFIGIVEEVRDPSTESPRHTLLIAGAGSTGLLCAGERPGVRAFSVLSRAGIPPELPSVEAFVDFHSSDRMRYTAVKHVGRDGPRSSRKAVHSRNQPTQRIPHRHIYFVVGTCEAPCSNLRTIAQLG